MWKQKNSPTKKKSEPLRRRKFFRKILTNVSRTFSWFSLFFVFADIFHENVEKYFYDNFLYMASECTAIDFRARKTKSLFGQTSNIRREMENGKKKLMKCLIFIKHVELCLDDSF
jgi:hypothetical protein